MDRIRIARELVSVARDLLSAIVPDEWMDAFMDGATIFLKEAKRRGYVVERPFKFIGGVRFVLDSAGGKDGVQVTMSLFKPVGKPWFVDIKGWVDGSMMRNYRQDFSDELPSGRDVAKALDVAGRKVGFWRE